MRIRGKLNLSFSLLVISAVSTFALISYFTFKDSIVENRDAVYINKIEGVSTHLDTILRDNLNSIEKLFLQNDDIQHKIENFSSWTRSDKLAIQEYILDKLMDNQALSAIALLDSEGRIVLQEGRYNGPSSERIQAIEGMSSANRCPCNPVVYGNSYNLFLMYPFSGESNNRIKGTLVYQLGIKDIGKIINNDAYMEDFLFFVVFEGKPVYMHGNLKNDRYSEFSVGNFLENMNLEEGATSVKEKIKLDDHFLFSSYVEGVNWTVSYVVPQSVYFEGLVKLRERSLIAVALIIILAIDIIFIIAHKISRPLTMLTTAIKDIVSFDYNTPLEFGTRDDEIGELASNFEFMRQKVKELTTTDVLTGVLNRRFFMISLEKEIERIKRAGGGLCCLMMDIDNFKGINDTWGHQCGDEVLKSLGELMISIARKYDIIARYGGEEFIIVLPDTEVEAARQFAERFREKTEMLRIPCAQTELSITISIGLSHMDNVETDTQEQVIKRADDALYQAKTSGKNRTIVFEHHSIQ